MLECLCNFLLYIQEIRMESRNMEAINKNDRYEYHKNLIYGKEAKKKYKIMKERTLLFGFPDREY